MAVNAIKIRLGAPDNMTLFGSLDLGASAGGVEFTYTPTNFLVEIDQAIMPVKVYATKEEFNFAVALVQYTIQNVMLAMGYPASAVTTVAGGATLAAPGVPVLTITGGAAATYTYQWVAFNSAGDSLPSANGTTAVGPTTLDATHFISIAVPGAVTNAVGYRLIRTVGGGAANGQGQIFSSIGLPTGPVVDNGLVAVGYQAAVTAPIISSSDTAFFGGTVARQTGTFDWSVPKNDGTTNHLRGHLNLVFSAKAVKIDYKRDKNTDLSKLELQALADLTQPVGQQGGYLREEY